MLRQEFENDVKIYGIKTAGMVRFLQMLFENDVKIYGIKTFQVRSLEI